MQKDIEGKTRLHPPFRELIKEAQHWEYGSVHSHDEIAEILGIEYGSRKYYSEIRRADDGLLLCGKKLEVVTGEGYEVINPDRFVASSNKKVKQSGKFLNRARMIAEHAPREKMDREAREASEQHLMGVSRLYSMTVTAVRPLFEIEQMTPALKFNTELPKVLITEGEKKNENN